MLKAVETSVVRQKPFTLTLPHQLLPEEREAIIKELLAVGTLYDEAEGELEGIQAVAKVLKKKMIEHLSEMAAHRQNLSRGWVSRETECVANLDYGTGIVTEIRLDTGEVINTRALLPGERQMELVSE